MCPEVLAANMPRDARIVSEILALINETNADDVINVIETKLRQKSAGFGCGGSESASERLVRACGFETLVLAAAKLVNTRLLVYLIGSGASVNFVCAGDAGSLDGQRVSPLHAAVSHSLTETVAVLLEANADVCCMDHHGNTPLHLAVKQADCAMTRMLLSRGAHAHAPNDAGVTPLQTASRYGHVELVRVLLEHGAQVFSPGQTGPSPLHIAASEGHVPLIDLFSRFVHIDVKVKVGDSSERAALHLASERGLTETVHFMVERFGAEVNVLDSDSRTPLQAALARPHDPGRVRKKEDFDATVEFLVRKQTHVNHRDKHGDTALHMAARHQFHRATQVLLAAGADPSLRNHTHHTAHDGVPEFDVSMKQIFLNFDPKAPRYLTLQLRRVRQVTGDSLCEERTANMTSGLCSSVHMSQHIVTSSSVENDVTTSDNNMALTDSIYEHNIVVKEEPS